MTRRQLIDYCLTFPDSYEDYPFHHADDPEAWAVIRHRGNKKSYAGGFSSWCVCRCDAGIPYEQTALEYCENRVGCTRGSA